MTKTNKKSHKEKINATNQVNQTKKSGKETTKEEAKKQLEKNLKEASESKENTKKKFEDLEPGDPIYGIYIKFEKDTKPEIINAKVTKVSLADEDTNEYYGSSTIRCKDNNKSYMTSLRKYETKRNVQKNSYSFWFLSKEDRDNYLKNDIHKHIESINRTIKSMEEGKKKAETYRKRIEAGEFLSLEEEIAHIEDEYDHEYGPEMNRIMDAECKAKIEEAKKKWANKGV